MRIKGGMRNSPASVPRSARRADRSRAPQLLPPPAERRMPPPARNGELLPHDTERGDDPANRRPEGCQAHDEEGEYNAGLTRMHFLSNCWRSMQMTAGGICGKCSGEAVRRCVFPALPFMLPPDQKTRQGQPAPSWACRGRQIPFTCIILNFVTHQSLFFKQKITRFHNSDKTGILQKGGAFSFFMRFFGYCAERPLFFHRYSIMHLRIRENSSDTLLYYYLSFTHRISFSIFSGKSPDFPI